MIDIKIFTFNPYQENTFVISDPDGACAIIDPGCFSHSEQQALKLYIEEKDLKVVKLLNTHGHIDHMLGNKFVVDTWGVPFATHEKVIPELEATQSYGALFGLQPDPSPHPDELLEDGDTLEIGQLKLEVIFTPGHSAGHISFYHAPSQSLFSGDVLFQRSIGRTDLPGGDYPTLMSTITQKLAPLPNDVRVYCGHGPMTTLGEERQQNPFILDWLQSTS
ncbi:MAG: MBL fold metallo-hydrolase [Bacteroidota bacterium]